MLAKLKQTEQEIECNKIFGDCKECRNELTRFYKTTIMCAENELLRFIKRMELLVSLEGYLSQVLTEKHSSELEKLRKFNQKDMEYQVDLQETIKYAKEQLEKMK